MERRYTALRAIGTIYKILGIIAALITLLVVLGFCAGSVFGFGGSLLGDSRNFGFGLVSSAFGGIIAIILAIIYGGGTAITLYALGEGVYLLLALEENTRATSLMLQRQLRAASPPAPPAPAEPESPAS